MFRLTTTAAWLRYLTTPPIVSQTVSGSSSDTRRLIDLTPTTATSPDILFHGVVDEPATLKRYDARCRVRMTTQLPGYTPQFHYRVVLRTINSTYSHEAWWQRSYVDDIWQAEYVPAAGDPRCKRLRTDVQHGLILSEIVMHEGPSPTPGVAVPRRHATIKATTFDWYVPVFSRGVRSSIATCRASRRWTPCTPPAAGLAPRSGPAACRCTSRDPMPRCRTP